MIVDWADRLESRWRQVEGEIRGHWSRLTEHDVWYIGGNRDRFVAALMERYGIARKDAERELNLWAHRHGWT